MPGKVTARNPIVLKSRLIKCEPHIFCKLHCLSCALISHWVQARSTLNQWCALSCCAPSWPKRLYSCPNYRLSLLRPTDLSLNIVDELDRTLLKERFQRRYFNAHRVRNRGRAVPNLPLTSPRIIPIIVVYANDFATDKHTGDRPEISLPARNFDPRSITAIETRYHVVRTRWVGPIYGIPFRIGPRIQ